MALVSSQFSIPNIQATYPFTEEEAIEEKLERSMKDYYKLGEIMSDKLQKECSSK